jgi:high-affinity nickel-transport protein
MAAPTTLHLALLTAAVFGFRHGIDYDHIAAISDITSVEIVRARAMRMGLLYVLGHAATVAVLGGAVILFQRSLPPQVDNWAERAVGLTLVLLGLYVLGTLLRKGSSHVPRSRASLLIGGFRWLVWRIRRVLDPTNDAKLPDTPETYSRKSVFLIGVIHGLGAETPSQLLLFLLAANLGGVGRGFLGLAMFLAGLLTMNTLMTASAVGIFGASAARPRLMRFVVVCAAAYSLVVGTIFLFGSTNLLPALGG